MACYNMSIQKKPEENIESVILELMLNFQSFVDFSDKQQTQVLIERRENLWKNFALMYENHPLRSGHWA